MQPFALLSMLWTVLLSSPTALAAGGGIQPLQNFSKVQISTPFNVKVAPASGFSLDISADQQVLAAVNSSVVNGVLFLATHGDFESQQPIYATVLLPKDQLQSITVQSPNNLVAVDDGFTVQQFSASVAGTSTLYTRGLTASNVTIKSTGCGKLVCLRSRACAPLVVYEVCAGLAQMCSSRYAV